MGVMLMNTKDRQRKAIFEMLRQKKLSLVKASEQCGLCYRQTLRVYQKYIEEGDAGLIHKGRGKRTNRRHPHRDKIISLYQQKYDGFGPTLASEYLLEEDGLKVNHETLRLWLLDKGLWQEKRKRKPYRQRRERKAQFGELVQIDGSIHDWFGTGKKSCLLNMVDDATGVTLSRLDSGETTRVVMEVIWQWIEKYGIPMAFYVDLKNVYVSPKPDGFSHIQAACKKLGIRIIKAYSPQAKGRVERNHGVYQDRFVKELKLRGVKTIDEGNTILESGFIDKLNHKFEKRPRDPNSAHVPAGKTDLSQILCWDFERQIQHDWTLSFSRQCYQVKKEHGALIKPKATVTVRKHLNGEVSFWYKNKKLKVEKINSKPQKSNVHCLNSKRKQKKTKSQWSAFNRFLFSPETKDIKKKTNVLRKRPRK